MSHVMSLDLELYLQGNSALTQKIVSRVTFFLFQKLEFLADF